MKSGVISPGSLLWVNGRDLLRVNSLLWVSGRDLLWVNGREELIGWNNFLVNGISSLLELGYCSNKLDGAWGVLLVEHSEKVSTG